MARGVGLGDSLREAWALYHDHREAGARARAVLAGVSEAERLLEERLGFRLAGLRALDAGCGQVPEAAACLATSNRVVGLDLDVVPRGLHPGDWWTMLRRNGGRRVVKTAGRKILGLDRALRSALERECGVSRLPRVPVRLGNVEALPFGDGSFDFVWSRSVLQHVRRPDAALREIARALRPGGATYLLIALQTSPFGANLPTLALVEDEVPPWPHLRGIGHFPPNAEMNRLRLSDWRRLLERIMPGAQIVLVPSSHAERLREEAHRLQATGELAGYGTDELLSKELIALWRHPITARSRRRGPVEVGRGAPGRYGSPSREAMS